MRICHLSLVKFFILEFIRQTICTIKKYFSDLQLTTNRYNVKQETSERLISFMTSNGVYGDIEFQSKNTFPAYFPTFLLVPTKISLFFLIFFLGNIEKQQIQILISLMFNIVCNLSKHFSFAAMLLNAK
jgi:hypothetical protein